ncbi:MAG TPA: PQQ-binding-like beta-propeller repeat protein [Steroidobacteraceae bacterium]|nr:PQQ-binding-like beta-propeller repeat protein [Steroidobacteraceae bacterium]
MPGLPRKAPALTCALLVWVAAATPGRAQVADDAYLRSCAGCHGAELRGGETGPPLIGSAFERRWLPLPPEALAQFIRATMPPTNPGKLSPSDYAAALAHIRRANGWSLETSGAAGSSEPRRVQGGRTEWLYNRGDLASTSYSPLDQIDRANVATLRIAWRWKSDNFGPTPEFYFRATPLMADGVLYVSAGLRRDVVAIDATSGETLWLYRPDEGARGAVAPRRNSGRGVAFWRSTTPGEASRVFTITPGFQLVALDARTGQPVATFGNHGAVDLKVGLPRAEELTQGPPGSSSPPLIVGNVVVVGAAFAASAVPRSKYAVPGWIRGFDAHTGALKWTFHTIPQAGELGVETWLGESWRYSGNSGSWAPFSADVARGYVYVPIAPANSDFYGGERKGNDLFADSLVCLDATTGKRIWHYQIVHHDVWDYDLPAPPVLADIVVGRRKIPAVVQVTKMGLVFVFNRVTGKPVWPILERRVTQTDVPGEQTSATQPFPTKPAPIEPQGLRPEDLIDFTPAIKEQALQIVSHYRYGPPYMPPSIVAGEKLGTLLRPCLSGGANWQGAAVDPQTGILYVSSISSVCPIGLRQDPKISQMPYVGAYGEGFPHGSLGGPDGLPLIKPPWGRITAIDLNTGAHVWTIPNTDTPDWASANPALAGIKLPRTGSFDQVGLLVTKTLLFGGEGSGLYRAGGGGNQFFAYDKATGAIVHALTLPANQSGVPMSYEVDGRQYIVLAVGAKDVPGQLIALALP